METQSHQDRAAHLGFDFSLKKSASGFKFSHSTNLFPQCYKESGLCFHKECLQAEKFS